MVAQWLGLMLLVLATSACGRELVRYPRIADDAPADSRYALQLLELTLARSGAEYELRPSDEVLPQGRSVVQLQAGIDIDVLWSVTSREREQLLRAVPIAIDRGLFGWRLLLIRDGDQQRFSAVHTIDDLAGLIAGQGHDWPDTAILRAAGLNVEGVTRGAGLHEMLARGRIDYFPRAAHEALSEVGSMPGLAVERELVLHYPSALYYFVRRDDRVLAAAIERGLEVALDDGAFMALFDRYHAGLIEQAGLQRRRVVRLANADFPLPRAERAARYLLTPGH